MISGTTIMILGWILLVSVLVYVISLFTIVALLKKIYPDYWQRIGSPSLFDPSSVKTVFPKIILGRDLPTEAITRYQLRLWALRASLLIGITVWLCFMAIVILGMAPK